MASCRQKLRWADRHLQILEAELEIFTQSDVYTMRLEKHVERPEQRLTVRFILDRIDSPPTHWPLVVGDIVHNLRSALDHAIWALIIDQHGPKFAERRRRDIAFPIYKKQQGFSQAKILDHLRPAERTVVERAQPYVQTPAAPDTDALWLLHHMWNLDKHRELSVVHYVAREATVRTRPALPNDDFTMHFGPVENNAEVVVFSGTCEGAEADVQVDADISLEVGIPISSTRAKSPFIAMQGGLRALRGRVDAVLGELGFGAHQDPDLSARRP